LVIYTLIIENILFFTHLVVQNFATESTALLMNMNCLRRARLLV